MSSDLITSVSVCQRLSQTKPLLTRSYANFPELRDQLRGIISYGIIRWHHTLNLFEEVQIKILTLDMSIKTSKLALETFPNSLVSHHKSPDSTVINIFSKWN